MGNSFGKIFKISTFGESHGKAIGVTIDGCPAGIVLDEIFIQKQMDRRKPGQSKISTERLESDKFEILSGVFDGKTTGTPIGILIKNKDAKSQDYEHLKNVFRPSHADFTYEQKYGIRDYRGGGRASARETATRVVAGAIAQLFLKEYQIKIQAYVSQVGGLKIKSNNKAYDLDLAEKNIVRCPDESLAKLMIKLIEATKKNGDSLGGIITCVIENVPIGLGNPVFDRLEADLAKAMLSINAVKGFEIGSGFAGAGMKGSDHNDEFEIQNGKIKTKSNYSGGVQGGISNGETIYFNVAFKPVATINQKQNTLNKDFEPVVLEAKGRHDPCVVPRAVPIVEAMAALVLADHLLRNRLSKLKT